MEQPSDLELLRGYACDGDESAFAGLVERHRSWMLAAARRRLGDVHLADDATQATFTLLAEKAASLAGSNRPSLAGWLFHAMHFACIRARRSRARQVRHESEAGAIRAGENGDDKPDLELLTLLEETIAHLPPADREAIALRFYRGIDFAGVGRAMNTSAEAARKRVGRALVTLRQQMLCDGVDAVPDELLEAPSPNGATTMTQQPPVTEFPVVSCEFIVADVEANLDFFEKLGFRRRWTETPDAMGRLPRASLASGVARIWLRRAAADENAHPAPGSARTYFWIDSPDALVAHRESIIAQGVEASPFFDDHSLRNFTVRTPDGYTVGFFTMYKT